MVQVESLAISREDIAARELGILAIKPLVEVFDAELIQDIELASRGLTAAEVARFSQIGEGGIYSRRRHIIHELGCHNMPHVIRVACQQGLFEEPLPNLSTIRLTPLQLVEINLISLGYEGKEIAAYRHISHNTFRNDSQHIKRKLRVTNLSQGTRVSFETKILPIAA